MRRSASSLLLAPVMPWLAGLFVTLAAAGFLFDDTAKARELERRHEAEFARAFAASLENRLDASGRVLLGLRAFALSAENPDQAAFEAFSRHLVQDLPEVTSVQLAPGGVIRLSYPLAGNESVLGLDLLSDAANARDARRAMESGQTVAAGPFMLRQGYLGLILRMPVYIDEEAGKRFWGFASVVLDFSAFARLSGLSPAPFPLALRNRDAAPGADPWFYGDRGLSGPGLTETVVSVPGGAWMALMRLDGDPRHSGLRLALLMAPVLGLGAFVATALRGLQSGNRRLARQVAERAARERELGRFEAIVSATPDMISLVDREHRYRMVNDSYTRLFGRPREFFLGLRIDEALGPKLYQTVSRPSIIEAFGGRTVRTMGSLPDADGRLRSYSMSYIPVPDADGSIPYVVINGHDITDIEAARSDRQRIFEVSPDPLCTLGRDGAFLELNPAWTRVLGWPVEELRHRPVLELVHPEDRPETEMVLASLWSGGAGRELQNRCRTAAGAWRWMAWRFRPDPERGQALASVRDETENRQLLERLRESIRTDQLTGAASRVAFWERAADEIAQSRRYGTPLSVCMLDLDHFKRVNDSSGHEAGDEALKAAAAVCLSDRRAGDVFCRLGGEEFAFMLPHTDLEQARAFAERIRAGIAALRIPAPGGVVNLTASIGVTLMRASDARVEDLLKRADEAMYRAKRAGRDRVETDGGSAAPPAPGPVPPSAPPESGTGG